MTLSVCFGHLPRRTGKKLTVTAPTNIFHLIYMAFQLREQGPLSSVASIYRNIAIETSSSNKSTHCKHYRVDYFPSGDISQERIDFLCNPSKVSFNTHESPILLHNFTLRSALHVSISVPSELQLTYHTTSSCAWKLLNNRIDGIGIKYKSDSSTKNTEKSMKENG